MKVLVCGGREYSNEAKVFSYLDDLHEKHWIDKVIQGGATGADRLALKWCGSRSIECLNVPANWTDLSHADAVIRTRHDGTKYDAKAGSRRNQRMIDEGKPDLVIAFPGQKGTADMISKARKANIEVLTVEDPSHG